MLCALTIGSLKYVLQTDSLFTKIINLYHSLVSQIVFPCPKRRHSFNYKAKQDEIYADINLATWLKMESNISEF